MTVSAVLAVAVLVGGATADDTPTIKEIMTKAHKGGDALLKKLGKQLKGKDVPWEDVQAESKELLDLGKSLGKNDPPKGDKKSWEKFTASYVKGAESLHKAADDKDQKTAAKAQTSLEGSCKACHAVHR